MIQVQSFVAEFWLAGCRDMVRNIFALLKAAKEPLNLSSVYGVLDSLPWREDLELPSWRNSFLCRCIEKLDPDNSEHMKIGGYFVVEVPTLTRAARQMLLESIVGVLIGIGWKVDGANEVVEVVTP